MINRTSWMGLLRRIRSGHQSRPSLRSFDRDEKAGPPAPWKISKAAELPSPGTARNKNCLVSPALGMFDNCLQYSYCKSIVVYDKQDFVDGSTKAHPLRAPITPKLAVF